MFLYRFSSSKYPNVLSGKGAARVGGRWNQKGTEVIYTSAHRSLALCEILVHFDNYHLISNYNLNTISIPDDAPIWNLEPKDYPLGWDKIFSSIPAKRLSDKLVRENQFLVLRVPSVIIHEEFNYIINPFHKLYTKVKLIEQRNFDLDERFYHD